MSKLTAANTRLFWNPDTGDVRLIPQGKRAPDHSEFPCSGLGCYAEYQNMTFEQRKAMVFIEFAQLVVGDKIDPIKLHHVFLQLEEYRDGCARDMPGVIEAKIQHGDLID